MLGTAASQTEVSMEPAPAANSGVFGQYSKLPKATTFQRQSFSSGGENAYPKAVNDPMLIDALRKGQVSSDPSLNTNTYNQIGSAFQSMQYNEKILQQSAQPLRLKSDFFESTKRLHSATQPHNYASNQVDGPDYFDTEDGLTDYNSKEVEKQHEQSGSTKSTNKVPIMLGAHQFPNFANLDPSAKNVNVNTIPSEVAEDAMKLLSAGSAGFESTLPPSATFQLDLQTNPEAFLNRPIVTTNTKYYYSGPDGSVGYAPDVKIKMANPTQEWSEGSYMPFAQDYVYNDVIRTMQKHPNMKKDIRQMYAGTEPSKVAGVQGANYQSTQHAALGKQQKNAVDNSEHAPSHASTQFEHISK